jgi:hypothetical protein
MHDGFKSKRAAFWLAGIFVLVLGFLAAAIVLPTTSKIPGQGGPDIQVPKMQNVPPEQAPKMNLEVEKKPNAPRQ